MLAGTCVRGIGHLRRGGGLFLQTVKNKAAADLFFQIAKNKAAADICSKPADERRVFDPVTDDRWAKLFSFFPFLMLAGGCVRGTGHLRRGGGLLLQTIKNKAADLFFQIAKNKAAADICGESADERRVFGLVTDVR